MHYSKKLHAAIQFCIQTHELDQKQKRKGKDIPYIAHPLTVGLILARAGAHEDLVIAGILHDTIEDSVAAKKVTEAMLAEQFGAHVAALVASVSENDKVRSWEERKAEALADIAHFSHESILLKSADILSNGSELMTDHYNDGDAVFARFKAGKEKILTYQRSLIATLLAKWEDNPLAEDLHALATDLAKL